MSSKPVVQNIGVGVAIVNNNKVLIVQRAAADTHPGLWELPGGGKENFEKLEETARREAEEETGLNVKIGQIIGTFNYKAEKDTFIRDVTQINFTASVVGGTDVTLSSEHMNFAWITKEEINNYNLSDETKEIINKAF